MCMSILRTWMWTTCEPGALGGQKRMSDPLELELQMIMSHHKVLGIQPRSSERAVQALT